MKYSDGAASPFGEAVDQDLCQIRDQQAAGVIRTVIGLRHSIHGYCHGDAPPFAYTIPTSERRASSAPVLLATGTPASRRRMPWSSRHRLRMAIISREDSGLTISARSSFSRMLTISRGVDTPRPYFSFSGSLPAADQ